MVNSKTLMKQIVHGDLKKGRMFKMKLSKEITDAIRSEIRKNLYQEAKTILQLTTDKNREDFVRYHKENSGNICCLVLDFAKQELVKEGILEQKDNDNFGKPLI
jgi:hypothetical protein